jgi:hypothetical protein
VCISDGSNGYLFADYDGDHQADAAVELPGMTSTVNQIFYSDII